MRIPISFIVAFVSLCFIQTTLTTKPRNRVYPLRDLNNVEKVFLSTNPLRNGQKKFPYVVCGDIHTSDQDDIYCEVHLVPKIDPYVHTGCGTFIYIRNRGQEFRDSHIDFQVGALIGSNKLIISWEEPSQEPEIIRRKVFIWDIKACDKKNFELSYKFNAKGLPGHQSYVITYNDTFDVVIADKSKCEVDGNCRLTYNNTGDLVKVGPAFPLDIAVKSIGTVKALSPEEGFFAVGYSDAPNGNLKARFISESGVMKRFDTDLTTNAGLSKVPVSTAYGLYSLCGLNYISHQVENTTIISCRQFDSEAASLKLNVTFDYPKYINAMTIYNIASGGFLSAALDCDKKPQQGNCSLAVDKIQADGQKSELYTSALKIDCGENKEELDLDVNYKGHDKFCFYVFCSSKPYTPDLPNRWFGYARECVTLHNVFK